MIQSKYFKIVPFEPSDQKRAKSKELISGDYWGISRQNNIYILRYISGDHQGGEKEIALTEVEYDQFKDNQITIEELLRIHGVG